MVFFKKKTVFKKSFFAFISSTNKKFWNERSFTYLVVSCKWHTLFLLILWNSWNNLLVLYAYRKKPCIIRRNLLLKGFSGMQVQIIYHDMSWESFSPGCKWHTLSLLILWNSWNNLLVLYTCIILYFEKKVPTTMVNTSTLYQQNKQPSLFQISEHKKTTPYGYVNPDLGLGQTQKCGG